MALDSYANLKQAVADHLDRDDLTSQIDDFIDIAEARHKREIRIQEMLSRAALTVDDRYVDLPAGFLEGLTLRLLTDPVTVLTEVNLHEMNRLRRKGTGKPNNYTIHAQFEFDRDPDQSYSGEIIYYDALDALDGVTTTNALLDRAPDVYLYAALLASAPFLLNDERIQIWGGLYKDAKDTLNSQQRSARKIGPLISRPAGDTP